MLVLIFHGGTSVTLRRRSELEEKDLRLEELTAEVKRTNLLLADTQTKLVQWVRHGPLQKVVAGGGEKGAR